VIHDVFICHASQDKAAVARPLATTLEARGVTVWLDEGQLTLGDSLRQKIDAGLRESNFGVVILSPSFFAKQWPQFELDGLVDREVTSGTKVVLPVWHEVDHETVAAYSPSLANKLAARTSDGIEAVAEAICHALEVTHVASPLPVLTIDQGGTSTQVLQSLVDEASSIEAGPAVMLWHDTSWFADPAHRHQSLPFRNAGRATAVNVEVQVYWYAGNCALATTSIGPRETTRLFARTPIQDFTETWGRAVYSDFSGRRWETRFKIETGPDGQPQFQLRAYGLAELLPPYAYPVGWDYGPDGLPRICLPPTTAP
jgi:hypothetical protein